MRILVTGANGLLGRAVVREERRRGGAPVALSRVDLDVRDASAVEAALDEARPTVLLNLAAFTRVDGAESEPEEAFAVNATGAEIVARAAAARGIRLLHLSTDFVFNGRGGRPYLPEDPADPLGVYGASKLAGERGVQGAGGSALIVRTSWLYGGGGPNFVSTMIRRAREGGALRVVNDQRGRPTWTGSIAPALLDLAAADATGILHVADRGEASWYELAVRALAVAGVSADIEPVASSEWPTAARRPPYSVLDLKAAEAALARRLPHWHDSLATFVTSEEAGPE